MQRHTDECRTRGIPFAADPSQQLAFLDGEGIRGLIDGAEYLLTNEYEAGIACQKTGWTDEELAARVRVQVKTQGKDGVTVGFAARSDPHRRCARGPQGGPHGGGGRLPRGVPHRPCVEAAGPAVRRAGCDARDVRHRDGRDAGVLPEEGHFLDRLAEAYGDESAAEIGPHRLQAT